MLFNQDQPIQYGLFILVLVKLINTCLMVYVEPVVRSMQASIADPPF